MSSSAHDSAAYPVLNDDEVDILRRYGTVRRTKAGQVLFSREGSMKRVAAAVGDGSSVVRSIHRYLSFRDPATIQQREPTSARSR